MLPFLDAYTLTFSRTCGYFEIDAGVPAGKGLWPAFRMLPRSGSWPPEIDVLELLGHEPGNSFVGTHWNEATGTHRFGTTKVEWGPIWLRSSIPAATFGPRPPSPSTRTASRSAPRSTRPAAASTGP